MRLREYLNEEITDEWKYFVSFSDKNTNEVIHMCGYLERPNVASINNLFEELKTDKEFGMDSDYVDHLRVRIFKFNKDK